MGQGAFRRGKARIEVGGAVIRLVIEGPCDTEWVAATGRALGMVLESPLRPPCWGLMLVVTGSAECTTEALLAIREAARQAWESEGRVATAWVFGPGLEGRRVMQDVLAGVYAGIMPLEVFESEADAGAWLQRQLDAAGVVR